MTKISIISPCYNGELHLKPYIEGLLSQTFTNVEYIFVNDGSIDGTEAVINSYADKFRSKGWTYTYIKMKNRGGQAKAINQGLKIFTGDYLCCIDSYDVIMPTFLEEMSNFLENNPECGIVYPWAEVIDANTGKHIEYFKRNIPEHTQDTLFDEIMLKRKRTENSILFATYMLRSSAFLSVYPNRKIYEGLSGQNGQLTLPFIYNYKVGYVKKILYKAIARNHSDSRGLNTEELINKSYSWEDNDCNVIKVIPNMPDYEKAYYFAFKKDYWENKRKEFRQRDKLSFFERLFSIKNQCSNGKKHKVVTILGLRVKIKVKKK